jgi:hypothetical protein
MQVKIIKLNNSDDPEEQTCVCQTDEFTVKLRGFGTASGTWEVVERPPKDSNNSEFRPAATVADLFGPMPEGGYLGVETHGKAFVWMEELTFVHTLDNLLCNA